MKVRFLHGSLGLYSRPSAWHEMAKRTDRERFVCTWFGVASGEKITVRIATQHPDDYPSSQAMMKLAEDLEERSGGVLECDVYTNNEYTY